ncbi:MAG: RNA methyltransferase [Candidatus Kapabacteria bacterium]|jgi:tRNA G18 (ribose-2'-O)-methylase SpoU|nr:RNA methyltransferase [Candidatus Kapabacteria bacterium]
MIKITDLNDPRIEYYKNLRFTPAKHTEDNVFVVESEKVTLMLLRSDIEIVSVFALPEFYEAHAELMDARKVPDESRFYADRALMKDVVGFRLHSGMMAVGRQPAQTGLDELSNRIVIMNGIINSENVGAIVRNCAAFGVDSILCDRKTSSPFLRRAVRVSMGSVMFQKIHITDDLPATLNELRNRLGYSIISAELTDDATSLKEYNFPEKHCIIFGSEGPGVDQEILDLSDAVVFIPISEKVASLNVGAAAAVVLWG